MSRDSRPAQPIPQANVRTNPQSDIQMLIGWMGLI